MVSYLISKINKTTAFYLKRQTVGMNNILIFLNSDIEYSKLSQTPFVFACPSISYSTGSTTLTFL